MEKKNKLFILFITAFLARSLLLIASFTTEHPFLRGDAWEYELIARNLVVRGAFSLDPESGVPDSRRTPLYPLFIALIYCLFGHHPVVAVAVQILLASLSVLILFSIGQKTIGERAAFFSSFLFALTPLNLFLSGVLLTETLFTFLLLLACHFALKNSISKYPLSGLFLGLAALTKPVGLYLPAVFFLYFMLGKQPLKKRLGGSAISFVIFAVTLSPWLCRNYRLYGSFSLSSLPGYNLYFYNAGILEAKIEGEGMRAPWAVKEKVGEKLLQEARLAGLKGTPFDSSRIYRNLAFKKIRSHPFLYLSLHFKGMVLTLFSPGIHYLLDYLGFETKETGTYRALLAGDLKLAVRNFLKNGLPALFMSLEMLCLLFLYAASIRGLFHGFKRKNREIMLFLSIVLYFILAAGPPGEGRYRAPADPFILLLAASRMFHWLSGSTN